MCAFSNLLRLHYKTISCSTAICKGYDLLDDLRRAVQINEALVDPHLVAIPGLGPFTAGGLTGGDAQ